MKRSLFLASLSALVVVGCSDAKIFASLRSSNYLPHRFCYLANPTLVWTNVAMDGLIAASYLLIFGCLFWVASRLRNLAAIERYLWIFLAFGAFILACGATHVMEIVTVWWPGYPLSAAVKVVCAAASVPTAILFAKASPALASSMRQFIDMLSTTRQEKEQAMLALIASEKLAVAGRISATISHEIQNPLQTAGDLLFLASRDQHIPHDVVSMLKSAAAELDRARSIARSTLTLHRESSSPTSLSLSELVHSVLDLQMADLARRNLLLQPRLRTPTPVIAYPSELRQILINLIQNAADATNRDGSIIVRVQPRVRFPVGAGKTPGHRLKKTSAIDLKPVHGYSITVADRGPGIDPRCRAQLFTLFFTTKGEAGTGLGLWLVRSMVEMQGGRIRFRSRTAGESSKTGTIFNIWIPLEPARVVPPADTFLVSSAQQHFAASPF